MVERVAAFVCIACLVVAAGLGLVSVWGPPKDPEWVLRVLYSCLFLSLPSGAIFSISSTLKRNRR